MRTFLSDRSTRAGKQETGGQTLRFSLKVTLVNAWHDLSAAGTISKRNSLNCPKRAKSVLYRPIT
jgi:hypothetical protein